MGFLDSAGLRRLWGRVAAGLGLKMDTAVYDPTGKARDVFEYVDALRSRTVPLTLSAAAWAGTESPYTQTIDVQGMTATADGFLDVAQTATAEQRAAAWGALLCITGQTDGALTVTADGDKPTVDLPVAVLIVG